jgi:hypothetical protein
VRPRSPGKLLESPMFAPPLLSAPIRSCLGDFAARSRRVEITRSAGTAVAILAMWMLVWCGIDRYFQLPRAVRALALVSGVAAAAWPVLRALMILRRSPDWVAVAAHIEQLDARFGQKLITVTSQALSNPDVRGSEQILLQLQEEVGRQLDSRHWRAGRATQRRAAWAPWLVSAALTGSILILLGAPGFQFSRLMLRFVAPLAQVPAVTTTRITLLPGDLDVVQSQPLTIEAGVWRLRESSVTLLLSDEERGDWSRVTMTPAGAGTFRFSLAAVDRDVHYYAIGGDARTPVYTIRVLRRPAVARFTIRYDYPPYTRLPAAYVSNDIGRIEAPAGTRATLSLVSTEPLSRAILTIGGAQRPMQSVGDPTTWQTTLEVESNQTYSIELLSTRRVPGTGPGEGTIRALPDLPPQPRLVRGGDSIRLSPHDIVPISYEALDDYGLDSLRLTVQVNGEARPAVPIRLWGDPRRQQDTASLDMATLGVQVGDVVSVFLLAIDTGGHEAESQPLQILISPASIDLDTYQRIVELQQGRQLAESLATQLQEAAQAEDAAVGQKDHRSINSLSAAGQRDRALSGATQTAALLRQSLLRCGTRSTAPLSTALAGWLDATEVESAAAQEAFRQSGTAADIDASSRQKLHDAVAQARRLGVELETAVLGERAKSLMADRQNLAALQRRPSSADQSTRERLAQSVARMQNDISAETRGLGLSTSMPDLDAKLRELVAAEQALLTSAAPVDFAAAADLWANRLRINPQERTGLEARLSTAAQAEAVRPDGDLVRARDLELASRAVAAVNSAMRSTTKLDANSGTLEIAARDIRLLFDRPRSQRPVDLTTRPAPAGRDRDARIQLAHLAGETDLPEPAAWTLPGNDSARDAEGLAMQANAAAAQRNYQDAAKLESALLGRLRWRTRRGGVARTLPASSEPEQVGGVADRIEHHHQAAQQEMTAAQQMDDLDERQRQISTTGGSPEQQRTIAEQIARVRQSGEMSNSRDVATAQVLGTEEQLAAMPQALSDSIALAAAWREASARAAAARQNAGNADPTQRQAADRAADQAEKIAQEAAGRLAFAARPLAAGPVRSMAQRLGAFSPEADVARDALLVQLVPALQSLEESLAGDDAGQLDRDAADTREAIAYAQRELAGARELLVKRDPLVAARWFARAAAESLASQPPDFSGAHRRQVGISQWLSRAWDQSIHRAAHERLAMLPSLAAVLGPASTNRRGAPSSQAAKFAAARQWDRMRDDGPEIDNPATDSEPSGYEQSLKLYFEALGKAQEAK